MPPQAEPAVVGTHTQLRYHIVYQYEACYHQGIETSAPYRYRVCLQDIVCLPCSLGPVWKPLHPLHLLRHLDSRQLRYFLKFRYAEVMSAWVGVEAGVAASIEVFVE